MFSLSIVRGIGFQRRSKFPWLFLLLLSFCYLGCGVDQSSQPPQGRTIAVSLTPKIVTIAPGDSISLQAVLAGWTNDSTVTWSVFRVITGNPTADSLSAATLPGVFSGSGWRVTYCAPKVIAISPFRLIIRVQSHQDTTAYTDCTLNIIGATGKDTSHSGITVSLTPQAVTILAGQSQQFEAKAHGTAVANIVWKIVSGRGSIALNGNYTAPSLIAGDSEIAVIQAASLVDSTARMQARITILRPPPPPPCFRTEVHPIFYSNCAVTACHNPVDKTVGLDFTTYEGLMVIVTPGDTAKSKLWVRLNHVRNPLTKDEISRVAAWILSGAKNTQCEPTGTCDTSDVRYSNYVASTIDTYCAGCHSGRNGALSGGIDLTTYGGVQSVAQSGLLTGVLTGQQFIPHMPKYGVGLDSCTINRLLAWINRGALND